MTGARRKWALFAACGVTLLAAAPTWAGEEILDAAPMHDKKIRLDGLLREWPARVNLSQPLVGAPREGDPKAMGVLGYDDDALYVAMQVDDETFVHKKDHAELKVAFPSGGGFKTYVVRLEPGEPGKTAGSVSIGGRKVVEAQLIEAPIDSGFTFEAKIPWSTFQEAASTRVGMRGALVYHDTDAGAAVAIGTSKKNGSGLPALTIQSEYALNHALVFAKGLRAIPDKEAFGNLVGDKMKERVAVFDRYLTVTGYHFRGGAEFFYQDLQVQESKRVKLLELADFDGDGFEEVVLQRQLGTSGNGQDLLEVWRFPNERGGPVLLFQHEVGIIRGEDHIINDVELSRFQGKPALIVKVAKGKVDAKTWQGAPAGGETKPVLLPWQSVGARTYAWQSTGFEVVDEKTGKPLIEGPPAKGSRMWSGTAPPDGYGKQPGSSSGAHQDVPTTDEAAPKARPPTTNELMDQVYGLYRTERDAKKLTPRFDFATNVAGDATVERVLVHGKDIVVFGKKFLEGRSYTYTTIGVEKPEDVLEVNATDLTGDGRAEVVVHGVVRAQASKRLGGDTVTRHAVFIYRILESGIQRVFAAETGRAVADKRVVGSLKFVPSGRAVHIEVGPGRAFGWTENTYPFPEDRAPYGGLEPLPLPWTTQAPRTYAYADGKFVER